MFLCFPFALNLLLFFIPSIPPFSLPRSSLCATPWLHYSFFLACSSMAFVYNARSFSPLVPARFSPFLSLSLSSSLSVSGSSGPFKFIVPPLLHSHRRLNCLPTKNKAYSTAERAFVYMHTATPFASSVSRCGIKHSDCLCFLRSPFSFLDLYPRSLF